MSYVDGWIVFDNEVNALINALKGTGTLAGLAVAEKAVPAMGVTIATGGCWILDKFIEKTSATDVAIAAADGTHPRKDLVCVKYDGTIVSSGVDAACKGTAEAAAPVGQTGPTTTSPKPPNIPTDYVLLAEVWVAAGVAQIFDADISDKRVFTHPHGVVAVYNTEYSWALLDAEQGVCTDGTFLFITTTTRLSRWTKAGARTHDIDVFHGDVDVDHAGDPTYYDNHVYVTCTNYPASTVRRVYKYLAADLSYVDEYNIAANPASGVEISGIAWDPLRSAFWLLSYNETPSRVYRYTTAFVYDNYCSELPSTEVQGITFTPSGRMFAICWHNLTEFANPEATAGDRAIPLRSSYTDCYEGLGMDPDGKTLWVCKTHTAGNDPLRKMYHLP